MATDLDSTMDSPEQDFYLTIDSSKLKAGHAKAGYRQGVIDGQEYTLQDGFNHGFTKACSYYRRLSRQRGMLFVSLHYAQSHNLNDLVLEVNGLLDKIKLLETENIKPCNETQNDPLENDSIETKKQCDCYNNFNPESMNVLKLDTEPTHGTAMTDKCSCSKSPTEVIKILENVENNDNNYLAELIIICENVIKSIINTIEK